MLNPSIITSLEDGAAACMARGKFSLGGEQERVCCWLLMMRRAGWYCCCCGACHYLSGPQMALFSRVPLPPTRLLQHRTGGAHLGGFMHYWFIRLWSEQYLPNCLRVGASAEGALWGVMYACTWPHRICIVLPTSWLTVKKERVLHGRVCVCRVRGQSGGIFTIVNLQFLIYCLTPLQCFRNDIFIFYSTPLAPNRSGLTQTQHITIPKCDN